MSIYSILLLYTIPAIRHYDEARPITIFTIHSEYIDSLNLTNVYTMLYNPIDYIDDFPTIRHYISNPKSISAKVETLGMYVLIQYLSYSSIYLCFHFIPKILKIISFIF